MKTYRQTGVRQLRSRQAFTLAEVVIALALTTIMFAGIVIGFVQSDENATYEQSNLAAQSFAQQGVEQARAAQWDPQAPSPIDYCNSSYFSNAVTTLDIPVVGANYQYATDTWTITSVGTSMYPLKMIEVVCTWSYYQPGNGTNSTILHSNVVATLRAPDQ